MSQQEHLGETTTAGRITGKRGTVLAIIWLLVISAGFGTIAFLTKGHDAFAIPSGILEFDYPRTMHVDILGNIVVADSGERRILGLAPDGTLRFTIKGEQRGTGFYAGRVAGFDSLDRFYVDDTVLDLASSNTQARRFIRYDSDGSHPTVLVSYDYEGEEMGDWEHQPIFMQVRNDTMYWFLLGDDGVWTYRSKQLLLDGTEKIVQLEGVDVYTYLDAVAVASDEAFFLLPDGSIQHAKAGSEPETIFPTAGERGLFFPTALSMDPQGNLLAVDGKRTVLRLPAGTKPAEAAIVLDPAGAAAKGFAGKLAFMDLSSDGEGTIRVANEFSGELVSFPPDGKAEVISSARRSRIEVAGSFVVFILAYLAVTALAVALFFFYWRVFSYMAPLVLKQLAIFVPLIGVMTIFVAILVYQVATAPLEDSIEQRLQHLAQLGASEMEATDMDALHFEGRSLAEIKESPAYAGLIHVVDRLINENKDPWNSAVYDYLYKKEGDSWWVMGSFDYIELYPYDKAEFEQVLASGEPVFLRYGDIYGTWLSALAPVQGADGKTVGILEATMSANVLDEASKAFIIRCIQGCLVIIAGFLAAFAIFTTLLLRSIRSMKTGADRIAGGDYDVDIVVRSRDEIQDLGDAFNSMSREIRDYITHVTLLNEANSRFVPSGFLTHLGKKDITEVRLGDQAKAEMTILFTDIRSFTDLSESMGPTELFAFLNDYLRRMGPEIREHGGFIDKYIGDAIMALFPGEGDKALEAVNGMFARLAELNQERKRSALIPVDMGVGIHRGPLMIGIIGEEMRFDGTVISDAVNLASRLESLTKYYGARAIVSEAQWDSLIAPERFPSRFLDAVRVKGKQEIIRIRELLIPGDPNAALKLAGSFKWESAWNHYQAGRFNEALKLYEAVLKDNPADSAAELFSSRCVQYLTTTVPVAWDGVTTFGQK